MNKPNFPRQLRVLLPILLFLLLWLPRGFALERFVTADEHAWLARSGNFYHALANGNYAETFQRHHPGVVVTWAGTLGFVQTFPAYASQAPGQFGWLTEEIEPFLRSQGHDPVEVLAAGRGNVVLLICLALLVAFLLARQLIGLPSALVGFGLIALDPFHIGLSRLLHLDGLLSSLMFCACIAFLHFQQNGRWSSLLISAVAAGLAWLTRSPGLFLLPFFALVFVLNVFGLLSFNTITQDKDAPAASRRFDIIPPVSWFLIAAFTFVLLWPAMWVDPWGSLGQVLSAASAYASEGHLKPTFFDGEVISGDPGLLFYPLSYLWRTTPLVLLGLVFALAGFLIRREIWADGGRRNVALILVFYALLFGLFMNLGAKKFDRYLLPIYPPLSLVAGMGLVSVVGRLRVARHGQFSVIAPLLLLALLCIQSLFALPAYPYYLSYYNPLLGGAERAPDVMQIGWGEGADQAARLLAKEPDAEDKIVASAYTNGPFSYFYPGTTLPITFWHQADYAVLYAQDYQRRLPSPRQIRYFESLEPIETVVLNGLTYAQIYALEGTPLPSYVTDWHKPVDGEEAQPIIRLVSYQLPFSTLKRGESVPLTLYLQGLQRIDTNLNIIVRLVDAQGNVVAREEGWPWGAPTTGWQPDDVWPDGHVLPLPDNLPAGPLRIDVAFNDPEEAELLEATSAETGTQMGEWFALDFVMVDGFVEKPTVAHDPPALLGQAGAQAVQYLGASPRIASDSPTPSAEIDVRAGDSLSLSLFWQTLSHMEVDYTVFVHIVGADGQMLVQSDQQPLSGFYPTSFWQKGRTVVDPVFLDVPADATPGTYSIFVGMYDLATGDRLPVSINEEVLGDALRIGALVVAPS